MKVLYYSACRRQMLTKRWEYDYSRWKTYKKLKLKLRLAEEKRRERIAHNDRVCRMYGIGKYSRKDYY
jgi:hypothetical protein